MSQVSRRYQVKYRAQQYRYRSLRIRWSRLWPGNTWSHTERKKNWSNFDQLQYEQSEQISGWCNEGIEFRQIFYWCNIEIQLSCQLQNFAHVQEIIQLDRPSSSLQYVSFFISFFHFTSPFPRRALTSEPTTTYCTIAMGGGAIAWCAGTAGETGDDTGILRQAASLRNLLWEY